MNSIRRKLLVMLLGVIGLLLLGAGAAVYYEINDEIDELFDAQLQQSAYAFPRGAVTPAVVSDDDADDMPLRQLVIEVRARGVGRPFYHSRTRVVLPVDPPTGFSDLSIDGRPWRMYAAKTADRVVEVAQPLSVRSGAVRTIAGQLLLPLSMALPLAALLIWIAVGRGLRPLRRTVREIERRSHADLRPLALSVLPVELRPMVGSLNELMERLSHVLLAQKHFIADAAHQLLTPLTALQLQAQWLQRANDGRQHDEGLADLRAGIERTVRLAQQLLVLARQEAAGQMGTIPCDLAAACREVLTAHALAARARQIALSLRADGARRLQATPEALRILLSNLLDNAIKYTPVGGRVEISVQSDAGAVRLRIEDSGAGIAPQERDRVFDRFYRVPGQESFGSGLGLPIALETAKRLGATLSLRDSTRLGGLLVEVIFPTAD